MTKKQSCLGATALILALVVGCDSGSTEEATTQVTGTVTFNGQPLKKGTISFESEEDVTKGFGPSTGDIVDGKFDFQARPGAKTVRISSQQEYGEKDETGVRPIREIIPAKYNEQSTLKKTVSAEGPNTFEFKLTK